MKVILRGYGVNMTPQQKFIAKSQASDVTRTRGTGKVPLPPRDVFAQAGPRGILINWRSGDGYSGDVVGWRIYKDNENSRFASIADFKQTQYFIEASAGTTPPSTNVFVSAVNALGIESAKVQAIASAKSETGAPAMPTTPPTYEETYYPPIDYGY